MRTLVDTSAFYALLDLDESTHKAASEWLSGPGRDPSQTLITHNYVIVETAALVHRRLGPNAVRAFFEGLVPLVTVLFVEESLHRAAAAAYLAALQRRSSFVDWVSFEMMRQQQVEQAFAFDEDFSKEGLEVVP